MGDVCEVHIFDFSNNYDRPENAEKNMHFHQLGLQGTQQNRKSPRGEFASFPEILKRLGHENRTIDIFKIDCEGCEWDTYKVGDILWFEDEGMQHSSVTRERSFAMF